MSGSYKINSTEFLMQPTSGRWMPRSELGVQGDGHAVYSGVREFEMRFNLQDPSEYYQLINWFNGHQPSGTVVVDLPQFGANIYNFYSYSGCVIREPEMNEYFNENHTDVLLLVTNIRTT